MTLSKSARIRLEGAVLLEPPLEQLIPIPRPPQMPSHEGPAESSGDHILSKKAVEALVQRLNATDVSYLNPLQDDKQPEAWSSIYQQVLAADASVLTLQKANTRPKKSLQRKTRTEPARALEQQHLIESEALPPPVQAPTPDEKRCVLPLTMSNIKRIRKERQPDFIIPKDWWYWNCGEPTAELLKNCIDNLEVQAKNLSRKKRGSQGHSKAINAVIGALNELQSCTTEREWISEAADSLQALLELGRTKELRNILLSLTHWPTASPSTARQESFVAAKDETDVATLRALELLFVPYANPALRQAWRLDETAVARMCLVVRALIFEWIVAPKQLLMFTVDASIVANSVTRDALKPGEDLCWFVETVMGAIMQTLQGLAAFLKEEGVPHPGTELSASLTTLLNTVVALIKRGPADAGPDVLDAAAELVGVMIAGTNDVHLQAELVSEVVKSGLPYDCSTPNSNGIGHVLYATMNAMYGCTRLPSPEATDRCLSHAATSVGVLNRALTVADTFWATVVDKKIISEPEGKAIASKVIDKLDDLCKSEPAALCLLVRLMPVLARVASASGASIQQACLTIAGQLSGCLARVLERASSSQFVEDESKLPDEQQQAELPYKTYTQAADAILRCRDLDYSLRCRVSSAAFNFAVGYADLASQVPEGRKYEKRKKSQPLGEEDTAQLLQNYLVEANILLQEGANWLPFTKASEKTLKLRLAKLIACTFMQQAARLLNVAERWVLSMVNQDQLAPGTRARALRVLGELLESAKISNSINISAIHAAIEASLTSDSALVREAAVSAAADCILNDSSLSEQLYEPILFACKDASPAVRKAAIRVVVQCFLSGQNLHSHSDEDEVTTGGRTYDTDEHALRAACHLVLCVGDPEESVQALAVSALRDLWFPFVSKKNKLIDASRKSSSGDCRPLDSISMGAQRLAQVAGAIRMAAGRSFQLPLSPDHPLCLAVALALGETEDRDWEAVLTEMSSVLLRTALRALSGPQPTTAIVTSLPELVALHALLHVGLKTTSSTSTTIKLEKTKKMKKNTGNATRLGALPLDRLVPYLSGNESLADRDGVDFELCLLALLEQGAALKRVAHCGTSIDRTASSRELVEILVSVINRRSFVQVVGAACRTLCMLAKSSASAAAALTNLVAVYYSWLKEDPNRSVDDDFHGNKTTNSCADPVKRGHMGRFCFILSQLCRYGGSHALVVANDTIGDVRSERPALEHVVQLLWSVFERAASAHDQETALQGLLGLALPFPALLNQGSPIGLALTQGLHVEARTTLQVRALAGLSALLQGNTGEEGNQKLHDVSNNEDKKPVARANGSEDNELSVRIGGILQMHWEAVLRLAILPEYQSRTLPGSGPPPAEVRSRALAVIESALTEGMVGPWTGVPVLVSLSFDSRSETSNRALNTLEGLVRRHGAYVSVDHFVGGLKAAAACHLTYIELDTNGGSATQFVRKDDPSAVEGALESLVLTAASSGTEALYLRVILSNQRLRTSFVKAVLREFGKAMTVKNDPQDVVAKYNDGQQPHTPNTMHKSDATDRHPFSASSVQLVFLAAVLAHLPFKHGHEVCGLLFELQRVLALHGDELLQRTHAEGTLRTQNLVQLLAPLAMLVHLRAWLQQTYAISDARLALFGSAERQRAEEKIVLNAVRSTAMLGQIAPVRLLLLAVTGSHCGRQDDCPDDDSYIAAIRQEVEEAVQGAEQSLSNEQPGGTPLLNHHELEANPSSVKTGKTSTRAAKTRRKTKETRAEIESTPETNGTTRVSTAPESRRQSARLASTNKSTRLTRSLARCRSAIQTLQVAKQEERCSDEESDAAKDGEDADWSPDMPRKRLKL